MPNARTRLDAVRWPTPVEARLLAHLPAIVVGIAGTSGKSVTGDIARRLLASGGYRVTLGLDAAVGRADRLTARDVILVPLPLEGAPIDHAEPIDVLAVTGLAPDELPASDGLAAATEAVRAAIRCTRHAVVVNADDPRALALAAGSTVETRTASVLDGRCATAVTEGHLIVESGGVRHRVASVGDSPFANAAFGMDLAVAAGAATFLGVSIEELRPAIARYAPPPRHFELLGIDGTVRWVDDGAATSPGRTAATLQGDGGPVVLVAGGFGGARPLARWARAVRDRSPHALLFGPAAGPMARALEQAGVNDRIVRCADLVDAVTMAPRFAERGDTVLFSPGCPPEPARASARFRELAPVGHRRREAA